MFNKLRRTAAVLSTPVDTPEFQGISRIPESHEIERDRELAAGERVPRASNPVLTGLEILLVAVFTGVVIQPLIHWILSLSSGKTNAIVTGASAVVFYMLWERLNTSLQGTIGRIFRLDFLDPYVGNRVKRTIQILKSHDGNERRKARTA